MHIEFLVMPATQKDLENIKFFADESIVTEEAYGLNIDQNTGDWMQGEFQNANEYLKKFAAFEQSVQMFSQIAYSGDTTVMNTGTQMTATVRSKYFSRTGQIETGQYECPVCHKKVDQLLKNGYCSTSCASKAHLTIAKAKLTSSAYHTLDIIKQVESKMNMLDMLLNLVTELPELIRGKAKLPQQYRDYITLRIDSIYIELKRLVNAVMIMKNEALIELMKKLKFGVVDDVMMGILAPLQPIMQAVIALQQALNVAMAAIVALLNVPMTGLKPQSYGWLMTAKSMQQAMTAGKLIIEIVPKVNMALPMQNMMNNMNYTAIEQIVRKALPPITELEYFLEPTAFKVRWALSNNNAPLVKKMFQILEGLLVMGADTFPRYNRLKLSNVWFVLSILTGWGLQSRGVYGDFIFHGPI